MDIGCAFVALSPNTRCQQFSAGESPHASMQRQKVLNSNKNKQRYLAWISQTIRRSQRSYIVEPQNYASRRTSNAVLFMLSSPSPPSPSSQSPSSPSSSSESTGEKALQRPNLSKYKSQRSLFSASKQDVTAKEINELLVRAGERPRDIEKWKKAIEHTFCLVSARLISGGKLIGIARATSDEALNATIWDLIVDPALPDPTGMKRNIVSYLLKELKYTVPQCSVTLMSREIDISMYESLDFVVDPDGIKGMAYIIDENTQLFL
mmetsp:Transcript_2476/g.4401  ORF Transcript_2476/g.4401 Transcript_2476/m.4401 type:complete len:264 (+) Transcript_2476:144-935(+)